MRRARRSVSTLEAATPAVPPLGAGTRAEPLHDQPVAMPPRTCPVSWSGRTQPGSDLAVVGEPGVLLCFRQPVLVVGDLVLEGDFDVLDVDIGDVVVGLDFRSSHETLLSSCQH